MHDTAMAIGERFFRSYGSDGRRFIVEIGSQDINGSLRVHATENDVYIGVDVVHGHGVDVVVKVDSPLPFRDNIADFVLSSSQLEHDPFFWNTFLEFSRITKPGGFIYINAPSNGSYHRFSEDIWRFYPDAGKVLERWARKCGFNMTLIESFTALRRDDQWNDFVAIFCNGAPNEKQQLICDEIDCINITTFRSDEVGRLQSSTEDMQIIAELRARVVELESELHRGKMAPPTVSEDVVAPLP